jgi:hypothetical protein
MKRVGRLESAVIGTRMSCACQARPQPVKRSRDGRCTRRRWWRASQGFQVVLTDDMCS